MKYILPLIILIILTICQKTNGQAVYHHVSGKSIYSFLDEMANSRIIELNSAVKPYTREFIARKLSQVKDSANMLNSRQQKDLDFYLKDYNKELLPGKNYNKRFDVFYYKDSLFTFSVNPILGVQYWNNQNGSNYHTWNGAEVFAYVGKHVGIYANLRDNHEKKRLAGYDYLSPYQGAVYKSGTDYSEMRGGITLKWNWGVIGLVKDHLEWGNNYHYPSIISSKAPSFTHLKLSLHPVSWFDFSYIHGWLVSGVIDSLRSYPYVNSYGSSVRRVYRKKFIAANIFTFKPLRRLYTSIGNSIIYSDTEAHPAYLIPFLLYKSVDHANNNASGNEGGQNSQFFIDISSRQINNLHFYATLFFDDVSISRLKENGHLDYYSLNAGIRVSNLAPNTFLTFEYFQSYPLVYKHIVPTTTYESNFYNLGHYLQDNSRGIYAELAVRPFRGFDVKIFNSFAQHGRDHEELGTGRIEVVDLFMDSVTWETNIFGLELNYELFNDIYLFGSFSREVNSGETEKYTAAFFRGKTNSFSVGVNYGF